MATVPMPSVLTVSLPRSSLRISQVIRSPLRSSTRSVLTAAALRCAGIKRRAATSSSRWREWAPARSGGCTGVSVAARQALEDVLGRLSQQRFARPPIQIHLDLRLADAAPDHLVTRQDVEHQRALF